MANAMMIPIRQQQQQERRVRTMPLIGAGMGLFLAISLLLVCQQQQALGCARPVLVSNKRWGRQGFLSSVSTRTAISPFQREQATVTFLNRFPRGGSQAATSEGESEDDDANDKKEEDEEDSSTDAQEDKAAPPAAAAAADMGPVTVQFKTNVGNQLLDHSMELTAARTRDISSLKKALARQLPGKPPMEHIRLMQHGAILDEQVLVYELLDDDDDEEEEDGDENKPTLTLVLDMVPPVDRRFQNQLEEKLEDMTTADLFEAYTLNEAAVWYSSQYWTEKVQKDDANNDENDVLDKEGKEEASSEQSNGSPSPLISFQLRQYANALKAQLEETILTEKAAPLLEDPVPPAEAARERAGKSQVRGQRIRPGAAIDGSGPPSSSMVGLKQNVQHYLNIQWGNTIRNFCLFLFFGYFGGRTVMSRAVLLLGAPMCFIIQARPVKLFLKEFLYLVLRNPPSIILSLLPAPQQACLSLSDDDAMQLIYGEEAVVVDGAHDPQHYDSDNDESDEEDLLVDEDDVDEEEEELDDADSSTEDESSSEDD